MTNDPPNEKVIFFFGAGASAVEGAPIASKLLPEAFQQFPHDGRIKVVKDFLSDFYSNDCSDESTIPTFEEILSPIDIALQKQEQFSDKWDHGMLTEVRNDLIYCICSILHKKLWENNVYHTELVDSLFNNHPADYTFLSLNYDILLDNALLKLGEETKPECIDLDYGIRFRNEGRDWRAPQEKRVYLLKLHGSLNWLYCPTCNSIRITPKEKGVMKVFTSNEVCEDDGSRQRALIIPPTWQKVYDNPHLVSIWLQAEAMLRKASKVIFIGYSMPESDVHIKYLMKKSLFRTHGPKPKIVVIDRDGKDTSSDEYYRYKRLFGEVEYHPIGFEHFVKNVSDFI